MSSVETKAKDDLILEIATPKGPFKGEFSKTTKVSTVIEVVITEKQLDRKDGYELVYGDQVLQPVERPLVSFGLPHIAKLTLVAQGTGV